MKRKRNIAVWIIVAGLISAFSSSCVVVVHERHRHYWHHGGGFHRIS